VSLLLLLAVAVEGPARRRFGFEDPAASLWLFAPAILFLGVVQGRLLPALLIQFHRLRLVSRGYMLNGVVGAAAQLCLGLAVGGAFGLLMGRTIGLVVAIAAMVVPAWRSVLAPIFRATRVRKMRQVMRGYGHQAYYLTPAALMNAAAVQLPVFVLAASFGAAASGAFFFCQMLANAPLSIYRRSITTMTAKEAQDLIARGAPLMPFMARLIGLVALVAGIAAAVLFLCAERLIPFVFGEAWGQAGVVAKWMGIFYAASAIHLPASGLATLLRFQRSMLVTQVAQFVAAACALGIGTLTGHLELTVALVALFTASVCGVHLLVLMRMIRAYDRGTGARPRRFPVPATPVAGAPVAASPTPGPGR
jgi:O-antigen/teichoic acid export membrane protein